MPKINTPPKTQMTIRIDADIAARFEAYATETKIPKSIHAQIAFDDYLRVRKPQSSEQKPA